MIGWFEDYHQLHKYYLDEHLIKLREVEEFDDKNPILQEMMQRISLCNDDIKMNAPRRRAAGYHLLLKQT